MCSAPEHTHVFFADSELFIKERTSSELLEHGNETSGWIEGVEFLD